MDCPTRTSVVLNLSFVQTFTNIDFLEEFLLEFATVVVWKICAL